MNTKQVPLRQLLRSSLGAAVELFAWPQRSTQEAGSSLELSHVSRVI